MSDQPTTQPVTEDKFPLGEQHVDPFPVTVMWHDQTESPSQAIMRLNGEVIELAHRQAPTTSPAQYEHPIIVVSDGGPITITETSHDEMIDRIRTWMSLVAADPNLSLVRTHDLTAMGQAAVTLLEVDASTGISLEDFGPVGDLVSRAVAYAYDLDPRYTTVHWTVA